MADVMTNMKNKAQEISNACSDAAAAAAEECQNVSDYVVEKAKAAAGEASKAGEYIETRAEDATSRLGGGLKAAGASLKSYAPQSGSLGQASAAVAGSLSQSGDYLQHKGLQEIGSDITNLIKKNPLPALLIGIGFGFLFARAVGRK